MYLAHGGRTDFRGKHERLYNLLSSSNVSLNARTENATFLLKGNRIHGSFFTRIYLRARDSRGDDVFLDVDASKANANGWGWSMVHLQCGKGKRRAVFPHASMRCDGLPAVHVDLSTTHVRLREWNIRVTVAPVYQRLEGPEHRVDVALESLQDDDAFAAPPHGLIGCSFDADGLPRFGNVDVYPPPFSNATFTTTAMGEGAIDGVADDYEMSEPFAVDFKFSRWSAGGQASPSPFPSASFRHSAYGGDGDEEQRATVSSRRRRLSEVSSCCSECQQRGFVSCTTPPAAPPPAVPPPAPPSRPPPTAPPPALVSLNGAALPLTLVGATVSTSPSMLELGDDEYAYVDGSYLSDFGAYDFTIEATVQAYSGVAIATESGVGQFVVRSDQPLAPFTGPTVALWDNGKINFRIAYAENEPSSGRNCDTSTGAVASYAYDTVLRFERSISGSCSTLRILVNGTNVQTCSDCTTLSSIVTSDFTSARMYIGANHAAPTRFNMNLKVKSLAFTMPPSPPAAPPPS